MKRHTITAATLALTAGLLTQQVFAKKGGTSILHLTVSTTMTSSGFTTNATGTIVADHKLQGGAEKQRLSINASGLDPNASYQILASTTEDTNLTLVADLTSDTSGMLKVTYVKHGQGKANPHGEALPANLDPVSDLRVLGISIGGTQTVLSADMTVPDKLQYLVKRTMTNDGSDNDAAASLHIKSNGNSNQLRIRATGLNATNTYLLAINGDVATSLTSDAHGGLSVTSWPAGSPDLLDVTALAIWSSSSNSVLSTTLP
jgi:hypothetical protein